ncbi:hypothetical protein W97_01890 [Coniosporium apollinis CBS 100218]|uniref:Uncharacterized protein n=1 Tax=Coniosporium apollinis (strain CBS 100218) TaxID=1168221 RepID=R7YM21_CONA1|nr:uncharacterized protein W97_01890 [Coniosporium apollinis CBS 100218]EON62666.1 hypothetical protein W97_01890 [Coniosporium apollinis CBS 100218]
MASLPAIPESQAPTTKAPSTTKAAESSALASAKRNIAFLLHPNDARDRPTRLRTRALLRTVRYIAVFIFWRLVRYAKYAVIGSLTAAAAGTVVGTLLSPAAFLVAPGGVLGGAVVGLGWGFVRVGWAGWRMLGRRVGRGVKEGESARGDEKADAEESPRRRRARELEERGVREDPW